MLSVPLMATLAGIGFVGSFVSGFVGVGGAVVMIPLLLYVPPLLGVGRLDVQAVAGVTMVQVLVATAIGAWTHGRHAAVHRGLTLTGGPAMALGSLAGAIGSRYVSGRVLLAVFALMTTLALPLMVVPAGRIGVGASPGVDWALDRAQAIAYPALIGLMAGLVGAGGAFLLLTTMSASMGFLGKLLTGQVLFCPSAAVVIGSLPGAPLGARVSRRAPIGLLRGILAALVTATAVRVWIDVLFQ
jgi:uncharacterized protein